MIKAGHSAVAAATASTRRALFTANARCTGGGAREQLIGPVAPVRRARTAASAAERVGTHGLGRLRIKVRRRRRGGSVVRPRSVYRNTVADARAPLPVPDRYAGRCDGANDRAAAATAFRASLGRTRTERPGGGGVFAVRARRSSGRRACATGVAPREAPRSVSEQTRRGERSAKGWWRGCGTRSKGRRRWVDTGGGNRVFSVAAAACSERAVRARARRLRAAVGQTAPARARR